VRSGYTTSQIPAGPKRNIAIPEHWPQGDDMRRKERADWRVPY